MVREDIIFSFPGNKIFADRLQKETGYVRGEFTLHTFPDKESLVTIHTDVREKNIILVCGLDDANSKILPLLFFAQTVKEFGAKYITLVTPYLGYMRQDTRFKEGQAITSKIFANFVSGFIDSLITIDPHTHRYKTLQEIYMIDTTVLHASQEIITWVQEHVEDPVFIGPDEESRQWVQTIAQKIDAPFVILRKKRHGDKSVEVSISDVSQYISHTPVLVDDIISTAQTMIKTVECLHSAGMNPPVCIGVHGLFADDAYENLKNSGPAKIVTTNAIAHETNKIDVTRLFALELMSRENKQ